MGVTPLYCCAVVRPWPHLLRLSKAALMLQLPPSTAGRALCLTNSPVCVPGRPASCASAVKTMTQSCCLTPASQSSVASSADSSDASLFAAPGAICGRQLPVQLPVGSTQPQLKRISPAGVLPQQLVEQRSSGLVVAGRCWVLFCVARQAAASQPPGRLLRCPVPLWHAVCSFGRCGSAVDRFLGVD